MHHAFYTKHIEHNSLIYIKLINIMIRTNYVMNQFGVKGQRHLWDPRGSAPGGGPASQLAGGGSEATPLMVNNLPYLLEKITFKIPNPL